MPKDKNRIKVTNADTAANRYDTEAAEGLTDAGERQASAQGKKRKNKI